MTPILAIAWNLLRDLVRKRSTFFFIVLVAGSGLALPYAVSRQGTLRMRLELAVTYGLGFSVFLISLATIFLAAGLAREVESRRIRLLITKPAGTLRILLGSLLGVLLADLALSLVVVAAFAASVMWIEHARGDTQEERRVALERFFTARVSVPPVIAPPGEGAVKAWVEAAKLGGNSPPGVSDAILEAKARRALRILRIPPGVSAEIALRGLKRGVPLSVPGEELLICFEVYSSSPREASRVDVEWEALVGEGPVAAFPAVRCMQVLQGVPQEVALPASAVSADGSLRVRARNLAPADSGLTVILDPAKVEALPAYGSFWPNVARTFLLLLAELALLASLVLAASCVFTSPTAIFLGLFLYLTALSSGFLRETFALYSGEHHAASFAERIEGWTAAFGEAVLAILPDFTKVDPLGRLAAARAVTATDLLREASWTAGFEGSMALIAGAWLLRRRELGK